MGAFFKRHMVSGEVVDSIQLPKGSPVPHGISVRKGYNYWTMMSAAASRTCVA